MSDVSEQAKELARAVWPYVERHSKWHTEVAQRAIDAGWVQRDTLLAELEAQGWTPPPDPWEPIAREVCDALAREFGTTWVAEHPAISDVLTAAVRHLHTEDEARAIAGRIKGES